MSDEHPRPPRLSAIVLCYRAGEATRSVVEPLHAELSQSGIPFELVLVGNYDKGGSDTTPSVIAKIADDLPHVCPVVKEKHGGMGWDMRSGLEAASGENLVVIDGDGQFDPGDVLRTFNHLRQTGVPLVKGRRVNRGDGPWRQLQSIVYNLLYKALFPSRGIWDINGKPKSMTRAAYEQLELISDDWFIDAEIMLQARQRNLDVGEIPVVFSENQERSSFVAMGTVFEFIRHLLRYRFTGKP